uniref:Uncharacterized protein n=1 Tax=Ixodes ricinus TaxID=34613 RepID=A0A0K8R3V6_IXORI
MQSRRCFQTQSATGACFTWDRPSAFFVHARVLRERSNEQQSRHCEIHFSVLARNQRNVPTRGCRAAAVVRGLLCPWENQGKAGHPAEKPARDSIRLIGAMGAFFRSPGHTMGTCALELLWIHKPEQYGCTFQ